VPLDTAAVSEVLHRKPTSTRNLELVFPLQFYLVYRRFLQYQPTASEKPLLKMFLDIPQSSFLEILGIFL
jgi:hypothetical protein